MLRQLQLVNFKSFARSSIRFGKTSIVIGANGSGKSNLFDALGFLRAIGEGRPVRDAIEGHSTPGGSITAISGIRGGAGSVTHFNSDSTRFEITAEMRISRGNYIYYVAVDTSTYQVVAEELKSSRHPGQYVYSTRPPSDPVDQDSDSPIIVARFHKETRGRNPRRDFSRHDFILSQFTSRRAESRINEEAADNVREEFSSIRPLELRPEVLREYSTLGRTEMGEHGENFASAVRALVDGARRVINERNRETGEITQRRNSDAIARRDNVLEWLNELTPRAVEGISYDRAPTGEVVFTVKESPYEKWIAAPSLSDGTLRFAALALAAVGMQGRRTLVIEEVENGINPSRLSLLIRMLEQASQESADVQIIVSTHSPSILDYASKDTAKSSTIVGWDYERGCSRVIPLDGVPDFEEIFDRHELGELQTEGWLQFAADA